MSAECVLFSGSFDRALPRDELLLDVPVLAQTAALTGGEGGIGEAQVRTLTPTVNGLGVNTVALRCLLLASEKWSGVVHV
jgi:hypothetical protein